MELQEVGGLETGREQIPHQDGVRRWAVMGTEEWMRSRTTTHALLDGEGVRGCPSSEAAVSSCLTFMLGDRGSPG